MCQLICSCVHLRSTHESKFILHGLMVRKWQISSDILNLYKETVCFFYNCNIAMFLSARINILQHVFGIVL